MKCSLVIISLLVFTEIQFTLCAKVKNESVATDVNEPGTLDQIKSEDSKHAENKSVQGNERQTPPNIFAPGNQENGKSKLSTTLDGAKKIEGETPTDINEMRKKAIANRDNAMKNAKLHLEQVKGNFETLMNNAVMERDVAFKKNNEQYKKEESIAAAIERRASKKFEKARQLVQKEFQQTKSEAEERYKKATEELNVALEAAEEEFEQARAQILENKQKLEDEHQPELEKVSKDKETAIAVAKDKLKKSQEKYWNAMRGKSKLSVEERKKTENEYQEEGKKYCKAVKLAKDEWQAVFDNIGIDKWKEAEYQALQKLQQAQEKADLMLESLSEELDKALEDARMKRDETMKQARADKLKAEKESNQILDQAVKQQQLMSRRISSKWNKIETQAIEDFNNAHDEFVKAKDEAISEFKKALRTINEMEKELTSAPRATEKIVNQRISTPRRFNSRKLQNMPSSQDRGAGRGGSM